MLVESTTLRVFLGGLQQQRVRIPEAKMLCLLPCEDLLLLRGR